MTTAFALLYTPWLLNRSLIAAGVVTATAVATMLNAFRRGVISRWLLAAMALFYALFAGVLALLPS